MRVGRLCEDLGEKVLDHKFASRDSFFLFFWFDHLKKKKKNPSQNVLEIHDPPKPNS